MAPSKMRGSGAPQGATLLVTAPLRKPGPALRGRSRPTALHCGVLSSLVPHFLYTPVLRRWREGVRDIDPRPHNGPGGCPPRTPGTTTANRGRGHRSPFPFKIASRTSLSERGYVRDTHATPQRPDFYFFERGFLCASLPQWLNRGRGEIRFEGRRGGRLSAALRPA